MSTETTPPPPAPQPGSLRSRARQVTHALGDFGAGLTLGALMGLILGMSVSPVAGTVVGGLVALLASFFGLRPGSAKAEAPPATARYRPATARMAGFGLGAIAALLGGVYLRTHAVLSPTPQEMTARWTEARFPLEQARLMAAYELVGTFPPGSGEPAADDDADRGNRTHPAASGGDESRKDGEKVRGRDHAPAAPVLSVLFADEVTACTDLGKRFEDAPAALKAWRSYSGGWAALAAQVEKAHKHPASQMQALETIRLQLCADR